MSDRPWSPTESDPDPDGFGEAAAIMAASFTPLPRRHYSSDPTWPPRRVVRASLVAAGVPYLTADLLATLTQGGARPDLRARVLQELER